MIVPMLFCMIGMSLLFEIRFYLALDIKPIFSIWAVDMAEWPRYFAMAILLVL